MCFVLQVRPDRVAEYRERHRAVWSEMRQALTDAGWHNYSLFLQEDGTLIGYLECTDFEASRAAMNATSVNSRWQALVDSLFEDLDGAQPDDRMQPIQEVFHLP